MGSACTGTLLTLLSAEFWRSSGAGYQLYGESCELKQMAEDNVAPGCLPEAQWVLTVQNSPVNCTKLV